MRSLYKIMQISLAVIILQSSTTSWGQSWLLAKHAGGLNYDQSYNIVLDSDDNVFIAGHLGGTGFFDNVQISPNGINDFFVAKYRPDGSLAWVRNGGGNAMVYSLSGDNIWDMELDDSANIYLTGAFNTTMNIGGTSLTVFDAIDAFVAKLDSSWNCIWAKRIGGSNDDMGMVIKLDDNNNVYIIGKAKSQSLHYDVGLLQNGEHNYFIAKYNEQGTLQWIRTVSGDGDLYITTIETVSGSVYLAGSVTGQIVYDSITISSNTEFHPCLLKLDSSGYCTWSTCLSLETEGKVIDMVISDSGYMYCCGTYSGRMIVGADTLTGSGGFVAKYSQNGIGLWAKRMGEQASVVRILPNGSIIVSGTYNWTEILSGCQLAPLDVINLFVVKLDATGSCLEATAVPNIAGVDDAFVDSLGIYYISGACGSTEFGNIQLGNYGSADAFWAKLDYVSGMEEKEGDGDNTLFIYANPNTGSFTVRVPREAEHEREVTFKVFDNGNRLVTEQTLDLEEEPLRMVVPGASPGIYYLQLITHDKVFSGKMVVGR